MLKRGALLFFLFLSLNTNAATVSSAPKKYNVLFLAIDALQARHVHALGYKKETTPFLDKLSKRGVLFSNAISPASWTVPTYLSIFSSTFPSEHGMTNRYVKFDKNEKILSHFPKSHPELKTIAQILKGEGYKTAGFTGDSGLSALLGYSSGFDEYTDETPFGGFQNSFEKSLKWLDSLKKDDSFFLFLHGYDCHGQFKINKDFKGQFYPEGKENHIVATNETQAQIREAGLAGKEIALSEKELSEWRAWYDSKIFDADSRLEKIYTDLEKRGMLKDTFVVIFSDHGTEFFEHGKFDHGHTLYDELINVPLLMIPPWNMKGKIVKTQVSTMDILPTVLDLMHIKKDAALQKQIKGESLVKALQNKTLKGRDVYSETDLRNFTHKRAIRSADGWKYIMTLDNGSDELYNLKKDPNEQENLVLKMNAKAHELREKLTAHLINMRSNYQSISSECLPVYKGQCE